MGWQDAPIMEEEKDREVISWRDAPLIKEEPWLDAPIIEEEVKIATKPIGGHTSAVMEGRVTADPVKYESRRRKHLRDAYAFDLTAPLIGMRQPVGKEVVKHVTDPIDRQWLIEEVGKIAKEREIDRQEQYAAKGFPGRFLERGGQVAGAFTGAGTGMVEAAKKLTGMAFRGIRKPEDIQFLQALEAAKAGEFPDVPQDVGLSGKAAAGAAGMAPDLSAGLLALTTGGPPAAMGYWTARQAPERIESYRAAGLSPTAAAAGGVAEAAGEAAIELIQIDPTGLVKRGLAGPVKKAIRHGVGAAAERIGGKLFGKLAHHSVVREVVSAGKRIGLETLEEGFQGGLESVGQSTAEHYGGTLPPEATVGGELAAAAKSGLYQMKEAAPGIAVLGGAGAGGQMLARVAEARLRKTATEIVAAAEFGKAPTRKQAKEWGLPVDKIRSAKDRQQAVQEVASEIQAEGGVSEVEAAPEVPVVPEAKAEFTPAETIPTEVMSPEQRSASEAMGGAIRAGEQVVRPETEAGAVAPEAEQIIPKETPLVSTERFDPIVSTMPAWKPEGLVPKAEGEVQQFIKGPEGDLGISVKALGKGIGFTKHAMQRFLTARGELPKSVFDLKIKRDGQIARNNREMVLKLSDFNQAMKIAHPKKELTQAETVAYDGALKSEVPLESLPANLQEPVGIMRAHIDALSSRGIEIGAFQGKMVGTVTENKGMYVHRSYKVHDGPEWANKVPKDVRNAAEAMFRQEYPNKSEEEIQGLIARLLYGGPNSGSPIAQIDKAMLGGKDLSILKHRKDLSREVRALLGEHKDIGINYPRSVVKLGNLIANQQFLQGVRDAGVGTFLSETPVVNEYGELKVQVAGDESSAMSPLDGLWTTSEIRDALIRTTGKVGEMQSWVRYFLAANAIVKLSKTVLSAGTHVRNFGAGVFFGLMQGHLRPSGVKKAYQAIRVNLAKMNDQEQRAYYLRLMELGVVGQGVHVNEVRAHFRDSTGYEDLVEYAATLKEQRAAKTKKGIAKAREIGVAGVQKAGEYYLAEDDFWKINGYENEKARFGEAMPEMPLAELEQFCAERINNTYATWSHISEFIQDLRCFPFVGAFVSFHAEMIRTTYHTVNYAQQELRSPNPKIRKIGAERTAGCIAAMTVAKGAEIALRMLAGVSAEDDEALRWFVAPWQENSIFLHLGKLPGKAIWSIIDFSYSDPRGVLLKPITALFRGGRDLKENIWDAMGEMAAPLFGEEILAGKIVDVWSNNDSGRKIRNPQDSVNRQTADSIKHLLLAIEPGTITSGRRIAEGVMGKTTASGQKRDPIVETLAVMTGQRRCLIDVPESLKWRARDFDRNIRDANRLLSRALIRNGHVSNSELRDAFERSDTARRGVWGKMSKIAQAAVHLRVPMSDVETTLAANGVPKQDVMAVIAGVYKQRRITKSQLKAMHKANPSEYQGRYDLLEELLAKTAKNQEK